MTTLDSSDSPAQESACTQGRRDGRLGGTVWWSLAMVLLGVQLLMRWWSVTGIGHYHDDLLTSYRALDSPFSVDYLLVTYAGHWAPVGRALEWVTINAAPFDAEVAHAVVVGMLAIADIGMALALKAALGMRLGSLVVYACWLFTPLLTVTVGWWSLGLNWTLMLALMAWTLYLHLTAMRRDAWPSLVASMAAFALLLLSSPVAVTFLPFLALLALAYPDVATGWGRTRGRRRRLMPWLAYSGIVVVYLAAYSALPNDRVTNPFSASSYLSVTREMILGVAFPSALGGTWASESGPAPNAAALGLLPLSFVVQGVLLGVGVSIFLRRDAWRAWGALAALTGVYAGLVAVSVRFDVIDGLLRQSRYLVPLLVPAYVLVGAAFLLGPVRPTAARLLQQKALAWTMTGAVVIAGVAIVEGSWVTNFRTASAMKESSTAQFWANVEAGLREHPEAVLLDRKMPSSVLFHGFIPELGDASQALRYYIKDQTWSVPTDSPFMITDEGRIVRAKVEPFASSLVGPSPDCGYLVRGRGTTSIPMDRSGFNWGWGIQLNYLAAADTSLEVTTDGRSIVVPVNKGIGNAVWVNGGVIDEVRVRNATGADVPVCVDRVTVGGVIPGQ